VTNNLQTLLQRGEATCKILLIPLYLNIMEFEISIAPFFAPGKRSVQHDVVKSKINNYVCGSTISAMTSILALKVKGQGQILSII